jgi:hypothetical protein
MTVISVSGENTEPLNIIGGFYKSLWESKVPASFGNVPGRAYGGVPRTARIEP